MIKKDLKLEAGGKPSTRFPPGTLVELSILIRSKTSQKKQKLHNSLSAKNLTLPGSCPASSLVARKPKIYRMINYIIFIFKNNISIYLN